MSFPCANPWIRSKNGADISRFIAEKSVRDAVTPFPCGQCVPCRINMAKILSARIQLESFSHDDNVFCTLTYEDEKQWRDDHGTFILNPRDSTLFVKRLRKKHKFRYFIVGEYGERWQRPHLHAILFGLSTQHANDIHKAWGNGFVSVGEVNPATCNYVVGYVHKKLTDKNSEELHGKPPEFKRCSTGNGGLGRMAIREVAAKLSEMAIKPDGVIRRIRIGNKMLPLGRHLTRTLANDIGISEETFEAETRAWQTEIFARAKGKGGHYKETIIEMGEGKRRSIVARHKIFKPRKKEYF